MKPPFTIRYVLVTPQMASEWLKANTGNRKMRETSVVAFAGDMAAGEWIPNHQGIAFGTSKRLLDGQHRLAAIVRARVSLPLLVFEGVPEAVTGKRQKTMDTIDRGKSRTVADMLRLSHGIDAGESFVVAVCVAMIDLFRPEDCRVKKSKMTVRETLEILEVCGNETRWLCENRPTGKGLNTAFILAPFAIARHVGGNLAAPLIEAFRTGAGLSADHPILVLRNHVMGIRHLRDRRERKKVSQFALACLRAALRKEKAPRLHESVIESATEDVIGQWPEMKECVRGLLESIKPAEAVITPVKLSAYAESLVRAKDVSDRIHRRLKKGGAK